MRQVNQTSINAITAETKTISAKLRVTNRIPQFTEITSFFGRNLINDDNAINVSSTTCYDAKMLSYTSGANTYYVLFRVIKTSDNNLRYWVASSDGTGTNGWINTNINIVNTQRLTIDVNLGQVTFLRSDGQFKTMRLKYENGQWQLYYVGDLPTITFPSYGYSKNSLIRIAHSGSQICRQISARVKQDGGILVDATHHDYSSYSTSSNIFCFSTNSGSVNTYTTFHTHIASAYIRKFCNRYPLYYYKNNWTPSGVVSEWFNENYYYYDYIFLPSGSTGNILAIPACQEHIGSWHHVFATEYNTDVLSVLPIDAITFNGENIALMYDFYSPNTYVEGATNPNRFIAISIARNLSESPLLFSMSRAYYVTGKTTSSNANYYPGCLRFVPYPPEQRMYIIGFRNHLSAPFPEYFGVTNILEIPKIQSAVIASSENSPLTARIVLDRDQFEGAMSNNGLDIQTSEYELLAGYNNDYNPIGEFNLQEYMVSQNESGESSILNLISTGIGRLATTNAPTSVEFTSPQAYNAGFHWQNTTDWLKNFTIANSDVDINNNGVSSKPIVGRFTGASHNLHKTAIMICNAPPNNRGHLHVVFDCRAKFTPFGIICRYTRTKNGGHRFLYFKFLRRDTNILLSVVMVNTDDGTEQGGVVITSFNINVSDDLSCHLINPHPGKYILYIYRSGTVEKYVFHIPDVYNEIYYLEPNGYYGFAVGWSTSTSSSWNEFSQAKKCPDMSNTFYSNHGQVLFPYYAYSMALPLTTWDDSFLNLYNNTIKMEIFYNNTLTTYTFTVNEIKPTPDKSSRFAFKTPATPIMHPYDNNGSSLGAIDGSFFSLHTIQLKNAFFLTECLGPIRDYHTLVNRALVYVGDEYINSYNNALKYAKGIEFRSAPYDAWWSMNYDSRWKYVTAITPFYNSTNNSREETSTLYLYPTIFLYSSSVSELTVNNAAIITLKRETSAINYQKIIANRAWFIPGNIPYSLDDTIKVLSGYSDIAGVSTDVLVSNSGNYNTVLKDSAVIDVHLSYGDTAEIKANGGEDFLRVYRDGVVYRHFNVPYYIYGNIPYRIPIIKLFGTQDLFAVYKFGELIFSTIKLTRGYHDIGINIVGAYKYIPSLYRAIDGFYIDAGSGAFQSIADYLSERSIRIIDKVGGRIRAFINRNGYFTLAQSINKFNTLSNIIKTSPPTYIRVISDEFKDYVDTDALAQYGYRLEVVNSNTIIGQSSSKNLARNILNEGLKKTNISTYTGSIDWRIEPGDVIKFYGNNTEYNVNSVTFEISQRKEEALGRMIITIHPKVDYLEVI